MLNIRVAETAGDRTGEGLQLIARQVENRNDLLVNRFLDESADFLIVHRLAHGIETRLEGDRHQRGMRAVKNRHFTLFIRLNIVHDQDVKRQLIQTQLCGQGLRPLNNKQVEMFSGIEETIFIPQLFFNLRGFITRIAGHDTVYERRTEGVRLIQPGDKRFRQRPLLGIAQHQFTQRLAVVINQLAGNDHPTFIRRAGEVAVAFKQQASQFCRIAYRWRIVKTVAGVVADPGLSGIGKHKAHIRIMRQTQQLLIIGIGADFTIYRSNQTRIAHRFALLIQAANNRGIEAVLGAERRRECALNRTHDHHAGIQVGMLVQQIDLPVDKRAQEVAFAKLNDTFRVLRAREIATV